MDRRDTAKRRDLRMGLKLSREGMRDNLRKNEEGDALDGCKKAMDVDR